MRQRVEVDAVGGDGVGMVAGLGAHDHRLGEVRCRLTCRGELAGELPEHQVVAASLDEPEGRCVPEHRRSAIAEHDLPAVGQREEVVQAATDIGDEPADRRLAVRRAEQRAGRRDECVDLFAANLRRSRAESSVGRQQLGRDRNVVER